LERRRTTSLTRTTRVVIRREMADATVIIVSLAIRAHTPPLTRTTAAASPEKTFITRALVTQHSGISLSEFIGTAT